MENYENIWREELYALLEGKRNDRLEHLGSPVAYVKNVLSGHDSRINSEETFHAVLEKYFMSPLVNIYENSGEQLQFTVELIKEYLYHKVAVVEKLLSKILLPFQEDFKGNSTLIGRLNIKIDSLMNNGIIAVGKYFSGLNIGNVENNKRQTPLFESFCNFLFDVGTVFYEKKQFFTASVALDYLLQYEQIPKSSSFLDNQDFRQYFIEDYLDNDIKSYSERVNTHLEDKGYLSAEVRIKIMGSRMQTQPTLKTLMESWKQTQSAPKSETTL